MAVRLNKALKELNVGIITVAEFLQKNGAALQDASPNAKITDEQFAMLMKEFGDDKKANAETQADILKLKESEQKEKLERRTAEKARKIAEINAAEANLKATKAEAKAAEAEAKVAEAKEEISKIKQELEEERKLRTVAEETAAEALIRADKEAEAKEKEIHLRDAAEKVANKALSDLQMTIIERDEEKALRKKIEKKALETIEEEKALRKKIEEKALEAIEEENKRKLKEIENSKLISKDTIGRNIIFYGTPGTGKSHIVNKIIKGKALETSFPELADFRIGKVFRTTFHPDTDYTSFVGSYKPVKNTDENGTTDPSNPITYKFVEQVFLKAYRWAIQNPQKQTYLVIEEINRGNCALIFGDIFQLLDRIDEGDYRFFSSYPIIPDAGIADFLKENNILNTANFLSVYKEAIEEENNELEEQILSGILALPNNLSILATMNTSDQSLFPMDSAFKRRWEFKFVKINYAVKENGEEILANWTLTINNKPYSWIEVLKSINRYIKSQKKSGDKMMGEFFIKAQDNNINYQDFRDKVLFYLFNDVFKGDRNFFADLHKNDTERFLFEDLFEEESEKIVEKWIKDVLKVKSKEKKDSSPTHIEEKRM